MTIQAVGVCKQRSSTQITFNRLIRRSPDKDTLNCVKYNHANKPNHKSVHNVCYDMKDCLSHIFIMRIYQLVVIVAISCICSDAVSQVEVNLKLSFRLTSRFIDRIKKWKRCSKRDRGYLSGRKKK